MELREERVALGDRALALVRPRDSEALLVEEAFEREELLPYWAELWPSAVALAKAVYDLRPRGRVVELGCGLGLPSLAAALAGASVVATDWSEEALAFAAGNAARNGLPLETLRVDWQRPRRLLARAPFDLVLAADVLYEPRDVEPLLGLLPRLAPVALLADPARPAAAAFLERVDAEILGAEGRVTVYRLTLAP